MTNQQGAPEALRLADALECRTTSWPDKVFAAAELRRLHAENVRLAALVEAQQLAPSAAAMNFDPHAELRKTWQPGQRWQARTMRHGVWGDWSDTISGRPLWFAHQQYRRHPDEIATQPTPTAHAAPAGMDMQDAYVGAREDLAIWKRRALVAERDLRAERETASRLAAEINATNGPTSMGEPVTTAQPAPATTPQADSQPAQVRDGANEPTYLCKAWGETDLPSAAIVRGLDGIREFLIAEWLGDADAENYAGEKTLPAVMDEMQEDWAREGKAFEWSTKFETGGISVQRVDDVSAARAPADSVTAPAGGVGDDVDAIALARYKVVPAHESMFHRFAVVAGDGKQQLYLGREVECANMARKFAGAFLDGAFYQSNIATQPAQAADSVLEDAAPDIDAAFEAVRRGLCKIPRYSFALDSRGNIRRCEDKGGNWIEFDAAHALLDPVAVDAARKQGGA